MSNLDTSVHRTFFHFETVHFKWGLAHRTRRCFWTMFTNGFLLAWWSFSWHLQMERGIVFITNGFWKYSWAHLVMSMTESWRWVMQCRPRARRPQASNKGLRTSDLSPTHRDFSSFSESFDDVMHCRLGLLKKYDISIFWGIYLNNDNQTIFCRVCYCADIYYRVQLQFFIFFIFCVVSSHQW